jgi:hypothetical protein
MAPRASRSILRYLRNDGSEVPTVITLDAQRPTGTTPTSGNGMLGDFSTVIESDQLLVADRTMDWGIGTIDGLAMGTSLETAITATATEWYLAEGATHGAFDLFYLLQNPSEADAQVTVDYLRPAGAPVVTKMYAVAPHSRHTIAVDREAPELAATDVSAKITSTQPIIVERAMYMSRPGLPFLAGHDGAGVTTPATRWFLAEGATGSYFDEYVLVANPGAQDATLTFAYPLPDGVPFTKSYVAAAHSRLTVGVDGEDARLADTPVSISVPLKANSRVNVPTGAMIPGASNQGFGAVVESDGVQIVVEQAQYVSVPLTTWTAGGAALATKLQ